MKGGSNMIIKTVKNKPALMKMASEYRKSGYNIITFGYRLIELERGGDLVRLEVKTKSQQKGARV